MLVNSVSPAKVSERLPSPVAVPADSTFEQRWNAWVARGRAHDLATRRTLSRAAIGAVIALALVAAAWRFMEGAL